MWFAAERKRASVIVSGVPALVTNGHREQTFMRSLFLVGILLLGFAATVRPADAADVRMYIRHEVADYAAWRKVYDAFDATRRKLGVIGQSVYTSIDNPNDATVTHDFSSADKATAFASSPDLKGRWSKPVLRVPRKSGLP